MFPHEVLKQYFERKKVTRPKYSLRALARDIGVSPSFLSDILSGRKKIPKSRIGDFVKHLDMDEIGCLQLKKSLGGTDNNRKDEGLASDDKDFLRDYFLLPKNQYSLLRHWYYVVILDLTTMKGFKSDVDWISQKIGISKIETELAIETLLRLGVLKKNSGQLQKTNKKLRLPTKNSQSEVRQFHQQMIKKAYDELQKKTDEKSFNDRLMTGATVVTSPERVQATKEKLNQYLIELADDMSKSSDQEIYQVNFQLFPLIRIQ